MGAQKLSNLSLNDEARAQLAKMQSEKAEVMKFAKLKKPLTIVIMVVGIILAFFTKGITLILAIVGAIALNVVFGKKIKDGLSDAAEAQEKMIEAALSEVIDKPSFNEEVSFSEAEELIGPSIKLSGKYKVAKNCLTGTYQDVPFTTMDIHCFDVKKDRKATKKTEIDCVKKGRVYAEGLFTKTKFNKKIDGAVIILPKYVDSYSFSLSDFSMIKMDNPAFESEYTVYATSQIAAFTVLDAVLMENMLSIGAGEHPGIIIIEDDQILLKMSFPYSEKEVVPAGNEFELENNSFISELYERYISEADVLAALEAELSTLKVLYDNLDIGNRIYV